MEIKVRQATLDDRVWLLNEMKIFASSYPTNYPLVSKNENFNAEFVVSLIVNHLVLIADDETAGPIGFIAGFIQPHTFNPTLTVLVEMAWWVGVEHRRSRAGAMLLDAYIEEGKKVADWVTCALEAGSPVKEESLTKRGFALKEKTYLMEVPKLWNQFGGDQ